MSSSTDDELLRALSELARDDEPPPLSEPEVDAMVERAVAAESDPRELSDEIIEVLAGLAREDEPPELSDGDAGDMVHRAVAGARSRERRTRLGWTVAASVAAAAAVALVTTFALDASRGERVAEAPAPVPTPAPAPDIAVETEPADNTELALPTGDRITATAGARFEIESSEARSRRIALAEGTMLFEVARLDDAEAFEVQTPHLSVRVLGTVFSIESTDDQSTVRVFEGRVEVALGDRRMVLEADEAIASSGGVIDEDAPLVEEGRAAADARQTDAEPVEVAAVSPPAPTAEVVETGVEPPAPATELDARRLIVEGDAEQALSAATGALRRGEPAGPWRMVQADALRALGRYDDAAQRYDQAAAGLRGVRRAQAGFLAAQVRFARLDDPSAALTTLDRTGVDRRGAPFEERALALRTRALVALDRREEASAAARTYLERFPDGSLAEWMQGIAN